MYPDSPSKGKKTYFKLSGFKRFWLSSFTYISAEFTYLAKLYYLLSFDSLLQNLAAIILNYDVWLSI